MRILSFLVNIYLNSASKVWTRFIEGELKMTDKIQQQIMHVGSVWISLGLELMRT